MLARMAPAERGGRAVYVLVALVALVPWLAVSVVAATGETWKWLEYPRFPALFAAVVAAWACGTGRTAAVALWVVVAAAVGSLVHERVQFPGWDVPHYLDMATMQAAPWVLGAAFGALVVLAITTPPRHDRRIAGAWLTATGLVTLAITYANDGWLTLENLGSTGRYASHGGWPDTKTIALVIALATAVGGLGLAVSQRAAVPPIPVATARRRETR